MNTLLRLQMQLNGMALFTLTTSKRRCSNRQPRILFCLITLSLFLLTSLIPVNAATTTAPDLLTTKPHPTKTTAPLLSSIPTPTPTLVIPPQCQECYGPTNNSGMTCFKNTLCVPLQYLCDSAASPICSISNTNDTSSDDNGDDNGDNYSNVPILCQDQLCNPQNFPPLPYQGSGRIDRANCFEGNFYSLYSGSDSDSDSGSSSSGDLKYTASCVEESMITTSDGIDGSDEDCKGPWEYFAIGTCFLKTCGPGMDCVPPFTCQPVANSSLPGVGQQGGGYGVCVDPNGSSSSGGGRRGGIGGSAAPKYSAREFLLQGLLIGLCTLALGVGLGVGFWRYKRKKQFRGDHPIQPHQQHRRRRTSSSSHQSHGSRRSRTGGDQHNDGSVAHGQDDEEGTIPPPPPLQLVNNNSPSSSSFNNSTKKRAPTWRSFLMCGPCFGYRRRQNTGAGRRIGGSQTMRSSSTLNRLSTAELDHYSHHPSQQNRQRRRDSRSTGDITENETDSQDDSSIHYHRHHGRTPQNRWRWMGQSTNGSIDNNGSGSHPALMMVMLPRVPPTAAGINGGAGTTSGRAGRGGMAVVLPEFEPPPMYHRQDDEYGLNLPSYGDISNGGREGVSAVGQQQQLEEQDQEWVVVPPLSPTATATAASVASVQETPTEEEVRVPISLSTTSRPTTPSPSSQQLPATEFVQQQQQ